jgi:hypothetical protein
VESLPGGRVELRAATLGARSRIFSSACRRAGRVTIKEIDDVAAQGCVERTLGSPRIPTFWCRLQPGTTIPRKRGLPRWHCSQRNRFVCRRWRCYFDMRLVQMANGRARSLGCARTGNVC